MCEVVEFAARLAGDGDPIRIVDRRAVASPIVLLHRRAALGAECGLVAVFEAGGLAVVGRGHTGALVA